MAATTRTNSDRMDRCFFLVGAVSTATCYMELHSSHEAQKGLGEEILGASDFGYVIGVIENSKDTRAPLPLVFINPNTDPLRDVTVSIYKITTDASKNDVLSSKPVQIQLGTILPGFVRMDTTVNVSSYQVDIRTRRAWFSERLDVVNVNGTVQENCQITKAGTAQRLFSCN